MKAKTEALNEEQCISLANKAYGDGVSDNPFTNGTLMHKWWQSEWERCDEYVRNEEWVTRCNQYVHDYGG